MSLKVLKQEIGWVGSEVSQLQEIYFFCEWTKLLAGYVANYALRDDQRFYPAIRASSKQIVSGSAGSLPVICHAILNPPIRDKEADSDPAGAALVAICMSGTNGITDRNRTRWPAAASEVVWALLVGNGAVNDCPAVRVSRAAWQRHLFSQALALSSSERWNNG